MKKLFLILLLFCSLGAGAQTITDTGSLRAYINAHVVTNGNRTITAAQLNSIFNAYLNLWPTSGGGGGVLSLKRSGDSVYACYGVGGTACSFAYLDSLGASGGGGSQTFPQVLATGRTLSASDSLSVAAGKNLHIKGILQTDTIKSGITDTAKPLLNDVFVGTSITAGSGATFVSRNYVTLTAAGLNHTPVNNGHGGYTLMHPTGTSIPGYMTIYKTDIPVKTSGYKYLFMEWGENDANSDQAYGTIFDYSVNTFKINYDTVLNWAKAQGWDSTNIILMSPFWQLTSRTTQVYQDSFYNASLAVANAYHLKFIDNYHLGQTYSDRYYFDNIHPCDYGHEMVADNILLAMDSINAVKFNYQALAINGQVELKRLLIRPGDTATTNSYLAGMSPYGTLLRVPGDAYARMQGSKDTAFQSGNLLLRGYLHSLNYAQFDGGTYSGAVGVVTGHGSNLITGIYSGYGYVDALTNVGGAIGIQFSPFGGFLSFGGTINTGEIARDQFYNGVYIKQFVKVDSGTVNDNQPYHVNTNGAHVYWNDKTGASHQLDQQTSTLADGIYIPAVTDLNGNLPTLTPDSATWERNGNTVTVSGTVQFTPNANTAICKIDIPLPVASLLNGGHACWGGGWQQTSSAAALTNGITVVSDVTNHKATLEFNTGSAASGVSNGINYFFQYRVQ